MSLVFTEITLKNGVDTGNADSGLIKAQNIRQTTVRAMVDTGAWTLAIDEETRKKLGLRIVGKEPATLANGTEEFYELAGPLEVHWNDRRTTCEALVVPGASEVLLGAIPLEAMDLMVHPRLEKVVGAHGNQAVHSLKGTLLKACR
jgi:clan AA aspartic protease